MIALLEHAKLSLHRYYASTSIDREYFHHLSILFHYDYYCLSILVAASIGRRPPLTPAQGSVGRLGRGHASTVGLGVPRQACGFGRGHRGLGGSR